jgi:hypothetical protein
MEIENVSKAGPASTSEAKTCAGNVTGRQLETTVKPARQALIFQDAFLPGAESDST